MSENERSATEQEHDVGRKRTPFDVGRSTVRAEADAADALGIARAVHEDLSDLIVEVKGLRREFREMNGSLRQVVQTVEGTEADRSSSLVTRVTRNEEKVEGLRGSHSEAQAVREMKRWIIGTSIGLMTLMTAIAGLLVRTLA